jgi:hypothetical protein
VKQIQRELITVTNKIRAERIDPMVISLENTLAITNPNQIILSLHAEILSKILSFKEDRDYLIRPKEVVRLAIEHLIGCEPKIETKRIYRSLLE